MYLSNHQNGIKDQHQNGMDIWIQTIPANNPESALAQSRTYRVHPQPSSSVSAYGKESQTTHQLKAFSLTIWF
jgi:hypothetical protein